MPTTPIAVTLDPSPFPYRFIETVNFRGEFDQSVNPGQPVNPKGIAYHPTLDRLLVSLSPRDTDLGSRSQILAAVKTDGTRTRFAPDYGMFRAVESKIAIVPESGPPVAAGFTPGEIFIGRGPEAQVSRLSRAGAVIRDVWVHFTEGASLWGGLCFDTEGLFGGRLIVLESNGKIYLVNANGTFDLFADLSLRTEGLEVAPASFGPFAKHIIVGVEGYGDDDPHGGEIYAISPDNEQNLLANIGFAAESIAFVPAQSGTYFQTQLSFERERENRLLSVSSSQFLNRLGRMIVVNEITGEIWEVAWEAANNRYTQQRVGTVPGRWSTSGFFEQGTELEGGCFAIKTPRLPNWTDWDLVPGGLTTDRAPAAAPNAAGDLLLFSKNQSTREVFLNDFAIQGSSAGPGNVPPGEEERGWTGWRRAPGSPLTAHALACSQHNHRMYAFAVQINGQISHKFFMPDESENTVQPWETVPAGSINLQTGTAVACATVNGRLVLCAIDRNSNVHLNEMAPGGRYWTGWYPIPDGGRTNVTPTVVSFQDELYVFIKGLNSQRVLVKSRTPDGDWSPWAEIPGAGRTDAPITAAATEGQLFLFVKGLDRLPYVNIASETGAWSGWNLIPNPGATDVALAPAAIGDKVFLFAKGIDDRQLYVRKTM